MQTTIAGQAHPLSLPRGALGASDGFSSHRSSKTKWGTKGLDALLKPTAKAKASADGAAEKHGRESKTDTRPTFDQLYLAGRINESAGKRVLSLPAIQRLNTRYGVRAVSDALRMFHGFPPAAVRSPYAYVESICKGGR